MYLTFQSEKILKAKRSELKLEPILFKASLKMKLLPPVGFEPKHLKLKLEPIHSKQNKI